MLGGDLDLPDERIDLVCRDPHARSILLRGLLQTGNHTGLPAVHRSAMAVAEAELVAWLASETQLGVAPDEIEFRCSLPAPRMWGSGELLVFAFRYRSPHWSAERGWMVGAVGPFSTEPVAGPAATCGTHGLDVGDGGSFAAFSLYAADHEDCIEGHVLAIADALSDGDTPEAA
jgi:hypothetical protein